MSRFALSCLSGCLRTQRREIAACPAQRRAPQTPTPAAVPSLRLCRLSWELWHGTSSPTLLPQHPISGSKMTPGLVRKSQPCSPRPAERAKGSVGLAPAAPPALTSPFTPVAVWLKVSVFQSFRAGVRPGELSPARRAVLPPDYRAWSASCVFNRSKFLSKPVNI